MGSNVWITPTGQVEINPHAWVERNTGPALPDLTAALHHDLSPAPSHSSDPTAGPAGNPAALWPWGWEPQMCSPTVAAALDRLPSPDREQAAQVLRWCLARGWTLTEPALIVHVGTRLNATVWIVRATIPTATTPPPTTPVSGQPQRVVVVAGVSGRPVRVYRETTPDTRTWYDSDNVIIRCPNGHAWMWGPRRQLTTTSGQQTTMTIVFGPNLNAPFSPCPRCTQHQPAQHADHLAGPAGPPGGACGCDGTPWIICPLCDQRCDLDLPQR